MKEKSIKNNNINYNKKLWQFIQLKQDALKRR